MGKRSELSAAERREAVLALLRREEAADLVARRFGVSTNTLYKWRDLFLEGAEATLTNGKGKGYPQRRRIEELEKDLEERDRVIGELTIPNRVLIKRRSSASGRSDPGDDQSLPPGFAGYEADASAASRVIEHDECTTHVHPGCTT